VNEQFFFTDETASRIADFAQEFPRPCCLCAPTVGKELASRGVEVRTLDIDERFADLPGFRRWDLHRPEWLGEEFGIIVCDPPFFNASLSGLFSAIRTLSRNDFDQPLFVTYLVRRSPNVIGTFSPFGLRPTGLHPDYLTVVNCRKNDIEFFSNVPRPRLPVWD